MKDRVDMKVGYYGNRILSVVTVASYGWNRETFMHEGEKITRNVPTSWLSKKERNEWNYTIMDTRHWKVIDWNHWRNIKKPPSLYEKLKLKLMTFFKREPKTRSISS